MKILIYFTLLFFIPLTIFASKNADVDSLVADYESQPSLAKARNVITILIAQGYDNLEGLDKNLSSEKTRAVMCYLYSSYSNDQNQYTQGYNYAREGLDYAEKVNLKKIVSGCCNNLCICYQHWGAYDKAIDYAMKSYEIDRQLNDSLGILSSLFNIANLYHLNHKSETAEKYINNVLDLLNDSTLKVKPADKSVIWGGVSKIYFGQKKYNEAYKYVRQAYISDSILENKIGVAKRKCEMARCLSRMNNTSKSMQYYREAVNSFYSENYLNSSHLFAALCALDSSKQALAVAERMGNASLEEVALRNLAEKEHDWTIARQYMQRAMAIHDSIADSDVNLKLEQYNAENNMREKEHQIVSQRAELKQERLRWTLTISVAALLLVVVVFVIFELYRSKRSKLKIMAVNSKLAESNAVKDKLIRVVSHDLSGTTANINMLAHMLTTKVHDEVADMLSSQSDVLKAFLDNLLVWARMQRTGKVEINKVRLSLNSVADEVINFNSVTAKQKNITLQSQSDGEVVVEADRNIVHCVIRNLVSNALKFTPQGGTITISFDESQISVTDTGKGMDSDSIKILLSGSKMLHTEGTQGEPGSGLGMSIVRDMIQMCGGRLQIESEIGKGSTFRMVF